MGIGGSAAGGVKLESGRGGERGMESDIERRRGKGELKLRKLGQYFGRKNKKKR